MKLISGIYSEIILIILISQTNDIEDIIKDFVALGFITEIDDIFARNMSDRKLMNIFDQLSGELLIECPNNE